MLVEAGKNDTQQSEEIRGGASKLGRPFFAAGAALKSVGFQGIYLVLQERYGAEKITEQLLRLNGCNGYCQELTRSVIKRSLMAGTNWVEGALSNNQTDLASLEYQGKNAICRISTDLILFSLYDTVENLLLPEAIVSNIPRYVLRSTFKSWLRPVKEVILENILDNAPKAPELALEDDMLISALINLTAQISMTAVLVLGRFTMHLKHASGSGNHVENLTHRFGTVFLKVLWDPMKLYMLIQAKDLWIKLAEESGIKDLNGWDLLHVPSIMIAPLQPLNVYQVEINRAAITATYTAINVWLLPHDITDEKIEELPAGYLQYDITELCSDDCLVMQQPDLPVI